MAAPPSSPAPAAPSAPGLTREISLPPPTAPDPSVLLVGVAHVLDLESGLDRVLAAYHPKALAVELDPERAQLLSSRVQERTSAQAEGKPMPARPRSEAPLTLRLWAKLQDRFASDLGGVPGEEMLQVGAFAKRRSLPCFLVDDPLRQVAPRLLGALSPRERVKLLVSTLVALFIPTRVVEREIHQYEEHREEYLGVLREQYPTVTRVLLDERNAHMAERIAALARSYGPVAAVVGDAHVGGLAQALAGTGFPVKEVRLEALRAAEHAPLPGAASVVRPPPKKDQPA
ncbi:MAG: TraB/GumN family protein [Euryarchaeota archaeon]|nr:TraB/GumN family protein [Euryarchaeota archaeon]MDE1836037.1 TraB/GumN family protein [Euryarchaeota archaeon]MDE2044015.1 TraB/GumN family protein [Thermoplasmata archaeon]